MPELKYGLNLTKKPGLPPLANRAAPRKTIFDEEDSPDEDQNAPSQAGPQAISSLGGLDDEPEKGGLSKSVSRTSQPVPPSGPPKRKAPQTSLYGDLSAQHISRKHAQAAQEVDPSVFDYDAVYDTLHAKPAKAKGSGKASGPKYMDSLLAAAEVRKRDLLRAKEKALQIERDQEGEEYADKEKFVTGAYKAQQEELRRIEAEEKLREASEMEKRRKQGGGMTGLYKDLLSREDERHERAMKAADDLANNRLVETQPNEAEEKEDDISLAKEKGAAINEDGQIVDKRQLLSAGLNIALKHKPADRYTQQLNVDRGQRSDRPGSHVPNAKRAMRERQTAMLERQLEEASKKAADDEQQEREELERANKRRATEATVSSAKERYLARKRAAEAAKNEG